jgi:hypothetical protein
MTIPTAVNSGGSPHESQATLHGMLGNAAGKSPDVALAQLHPRSRGACRPELSGACANMLRLIWRKISAFKCWPAPRACRCLTSPAHSNSRKACPRTSTWCDVACGVCRNSWRRQICLSRKSRALPGFRIRAIARAGSGSRSASLRAATDGRCARTSPHGNPIAGA